MEKRRDKARDRGARGFGRRWLGPARGMALPLLVMAFLFTSSSARAQTAPLNLVAGPPSPAQGACRAQCGR